MRRVRRAGRLWFFQVDDAVRYFDPTDPLLQEYRVEIGADSLNYVEFILAIEESGRDE